MLWIRYLRKKAETVCGGVCAVLADTLLLPVSPFSPLQAAVRNLKTCERFYQERVGKLAVTNPPFFRSNPYLSFSMLAFHPARSSSFSPLPFLQSPAPSSKFLFKRKPCGGSSKRSVGDLETPFGGFSQKVLVVLLKKQKKNKGGNLLLQFIQ